MNSPAKRPSTFEEILHELAAAGRPVTVGDALLVMVDEMNACLGTQHEGDQTGSRAPQTDAERRADIERTLALMDKLRRQFKLPPDGAKGAPN